MPRVKHEGARVVDPPNYLQMLGDQIRRHRLALQLSQADVAEKADISLKYFGEVERGEKNPTAKTIGRIVRALDWNGFEGFANVVATTTVSQIDREFRDDLIRSAFPLALSEFYRSGGAGMAWDGYDDVAGSVMNAVDAMLRARAK